jgi:heme ABC exporter ATP-binding subunit CcmA
LTVAAGEIVALVGSNGAGKTSLLRCLAGALRPASGQVLWWGERDCKRPTVRERIGFVAHESSLYPALTAWENLLFAGQMWGIDAPQTRVADVLSVVGLEDQKAQTTAQLSQGMRQRLAIARAVIHDPAIVLLDEPFNSLDTDGREWLEAFLCDLRSRNRALLLATHHSLHSSGFVDRMVRLCPDGLREIHPWSSRQDWARSA